MIPEFDSKGRLPAGIHRVKWDEFVLRFGNSPYRQRLITGLKLAVECLCISGCQTLYLDGSFVTDKEKHLGEPPNDYDACWCTDNIDYDLLDPIFLIFENGRVAQKARFFGEFFPAEWSEGVSGLTFLEFFQQDKDTGEPKGIIALDLRSLI